MNGVAEALLEELLAQTKTNTQLLQQMARSFSGSGGGGGGGAGNAAAAASGLVSSFNPLSLGIKAITGSFSLLKNIVGGIIGIFSSLVSATIGVVKNLVDFGKKAMETGVKLSDFLNVFGGVPILGTLFKIGSSLAGIAEGLLESYRDISSVGATFGGDFMAVSKAAANAGLTIGEFGRIVRQNGEIFSYFGTTVQAGVNVFSNSVRKMFAPDSQTGISILGLGVRFDEAAEYLAGYMMNLAQTGEMERMNSDEIAAAGREYIVQLDGLARLTGQERKQLDEKMKAARLDQNFQAYLASLEPKQRQVVQRMVETASAISPDLGREVRARFLGVTAPVTEMGKSFAATGSVFMNDINLFRKAMNSGMNSTEAHSYMLELTAKLGMNQAELIRKAPYLLESGFVTLDGAVTGLGNRVNKSGGDITKAFADIEKEQKDASTGSANAMAQTELTMRDLGNAFNQAFLAVAGNLIPVVKELGIGMANLVMKYIVPLARAMAPLVKQFLDWTLDVAEIAKKDGLRAAFTKIFTDVSGQLSNLWALIKGPVISVFEKIRDFLTPFFEELMIKMEYYVDRFIDSKIGGINEKDEKERVAKRDYDIAALRLKSETDAQALEMRRIELYRTFQARIATLKEVGGYSVTAEGKTVYGRQRQIDELTRQFEQMIGASATDSRQRRHSGTIGMTGSWWEKEDKTVDIQAGETVLTQNQLAQIVETTGQNNLATEVRKLNSLTAQMLEYLKQTADNTRQSTKAVRGLNGNIFEAV